jgi:hypothetical protein
VAKRKQIKNVQAPVRRLGFCACLAGGFEAGGEFSVGGDEDAEVLQESMVDVVDPAMNGELLTWRS